MAPRLEFSPSLSTVTPIPLTHAVSNSIPFKIQVRLSRGWYERLHDGGRQIQVWSNIHVGHGGEQFWAETPFLLPTSDDVTRSTQPSVAMISLLTSDPAEDVDVAVNVTDDKVAILVASFEIPNKIAQYAFTFRIAGPYSQMEWLGNMGSNGILVVGRDEHRIGFDSCIDEGVWTLEQGRWEGPVHSKEESVEIGCFRNVDMCGWALGSDGVRQDVTSLNGVTSNIFVLYPRNVPHGKVEPPLPLIIHSRVPITVSSGIVTVNSSTPAPVLVTELKSALTFGDVKTIVSNASDGMLELVSMPPKPSRYLVIKACDAKSGLSHRAQVHILPAAPSLPPHSRLTFSLENLILSTFTEKTRTVVFYNPANDAIVFIENDRIHSEQSSLGVLVGPEGGELLLLPSHSVTDEEEGWQVAVVSPEVKEVIRETITPVVVSVPTVNEPTADSEAVPVEDILPPEPMANLPPPEMDEKVIVEDQPPSNLPTPPPSVPAALHELAASSDTEHHAYDTQGEPEGHAHIGENRIEDSHADEAEKPVSDTDQPSPRPSPVSMVLFGGARPLTAASFRSMAVASILALWMRVSSVFRFIVLLTFGRGHRRVRANNPPALPRDAVASPSLPELPGKERGVPSHSETLPQAPLVVDEVPTSAAADETVKENVVEEVILDADHLKDRVFRDEAAKGGPVEEETKDGSTMILTPPLTPPTTMLPIHSDAAHFSPTTEPLPPKHELRLTLRAGSLFRGIIFHSRADRTSDLSRDVTISVDGRDLDVNAAKPASGLTTGGKRPCWFFEGTSDGALGANECRVVLAVDV